MNLFPLIKKIEIVLHNETTFVKNLKLRTAKDIYSTKNKHFYIGKVQPSKFVIKYRVSSSGYRSNFFLINGTITNSTLLLEAKPYKGHFIMLGVWILTLFWLFFSIDKLWFLPFAIVPIILFWYLMNLIFALVLKNKAIHIIESIVRIAEKSNEDIR